LKSSPRRIGIFRIIQSIMACRCFHSPKLVYLLILHIVHMPLPWWDGDVLEHQQVVQASTNDEAEQGQIVVTRYTLDIDVILLGLHPPDDLDDGPLSNRHHHPEEELFGASYVQRTVSQEPVLRMSELFVPVVIDVAPLAAAWNPLPLSGPLQRPHSLSATHVTAQSWRIVLSVIRC
jgi:hypothetical protein